MIEGEGIEPLDEDVAVALARVSVDTFVLTGETLQLPEDTPNELCERAAGCFVSLHEGGELRGCIGTIMACEENLALEIIHNAVSAASCDPRFDPVAPEELDSLDISVDVLGPIEPVDDKGELDAHRYGVIVSCGARRGVLLPDLEGVDTVEDQIAIARAKAGIEKHESVTLERFEVVRHL